MKTGRKTWESPEIGVSRDSTHRYLVGVGNTKDSDEHEHDQDGKHRFGGHVPSIFGFQGSCPGRKLGGTCRGRVTLANECTNFSISSQLIFAL
jgi:hypothetical protein